MTSIAPRALRLPVLALLTNALAWGLSWWPLRRLQEAGVHPLWSTALVFAVAVLVVAIGQRQALRLLWRHPPLWGLLLAAGLTNAAFNWGVTIGDVVRVVLLFYLMPLWAVLLARLVLGEKLTPSTLTSTALALAGAVVVLKPAGAGLPLPQGLADWLGVLGGFTFACNNVMLRKYAHLPGEGRAIAMFAGGMLVSGCGAALLVAHGGASLPPPALLSWVPWVLALTSMLMLGNFALQYGAAQLSANVTAIVMLSEILFAAVSAAWFGGQAIDAQTWLGGALIVGASLLSVAVRRR